MKKLFATIAAAVLAVGVAFGASACGQVSKESDEGVPAKETPIVGYVAEGPITAWRTAHEKDVQTAFKNASMDMVYMPSTKHKEQVASFDKFVRDKVDAILLTPAQAAGWTDSLEKAKKADIPVFLLDSSVDTDDTSLYTTKIGPSNTWAGEQAAKYINSAFPDGAKGIMLEGPDGNSDTTERTAGWDSALADNVAVVDSAKGDLSVDTAVEQTTELLEKFKGDDIKFIFAQNDEMGLGAADAVKALADAQAEASGKSGASNSSGETGSSSSSPASDSSSDSDASSASGSATTDYANIKIVTIDATKPALRALISGKFASVIEYNPLFGEKTASAVQKVLGGEKVAKSLPVSSKVFTPDSAKEALNTRKY
jgi:simple sugar transport system substrate-binding protein